ncbi:Dyp-type peroxidase [Pseudomonas sp. NA-150]|uniref:Dyp-type peroxidase n=1 Tax=Pseudomonas sp. NA-150 TaxID=3367525 RepID=UPI0037C895A9
MPKSTFTEADARDTQALLKTAFDSLACTLLLLRIEDAAVARAWLRSHINSVASVQQIGRDKPPVEHTLQMSLSAAGLRALGHQAILDQCASEFSTSLADAPDRLQRLGDIAENAPSNWAWGVAEREPHVLLMLFASKEQLAAFSTRMQESALTAGLTIVQRLDTSDMHGFEPFGFKDGISQPGIDWDGTRDPGSDADMDYQNRITLGEFLLGYRNEYNLYTQRPLLPAQDSNAQSLPIAEDQPDRRDLGRNGSYLVLRQLQQDVNGFWRWVYGQAAGDAAAATAQAQAMVGRQISGEPLHGVDAQKSDQPANDFTFTHDRAGQVCPIGAHIRRANPRSGDYPDGRTGRVEKLLTLLGLRGSAEDDRIASSRFHRLIRRGREYGSALPPAQAAQATDNGSETGLHFICLNANLARQFEFIQGAWLANAKFAGLSNEQDPLLGNRQPFPGNQPTDRFTRPQAAGPGLVSANLPPFITVRGGAYFLLPGLRALAWLLADPPN